MANSNRDYREHVCPYCNNGSVTVDYSEDIGTKRQVIHCYNCNQNVWFRVFNTKVKSGWHSKDNKGESNG